MKCIIICLNSLTVVVISVILKDLEERIDIYFQTESSLFLFFNLIFF